MPDPSEPDPRDELIAAYLDGEATADEIARVESSPALMAQVQTFQAVADLVATPPPVPDPAQRDRHVAAALAAAGTADNVTALAAARPWYRRPIVAAAAVIVAAVLAIPLLAQLGGRDDADVAGEPTITAAAAESAAESDGGSGGDEALGGAELDRHQIESSQSAPAEAPPAEADGEDNAADGATAGDVTEGASVATTAAPGVVIGRLHADGDTFADFDEAIEAYEQLLDADDQAELAATEFYEIVETDEVSRRCLQSFGLGIIVVADVGGTDVLIGRANAETIVVATRTCEQLFPE